MTTQFTSRLSRLHKILAKDGCRSAALLGSGTFRKRAGGSFYPFEPNEDFYYTTGIQEPNVLLFIQEQPKRRILFCPKASSTHQAWLGRHISPKALANRIKAELVVSDTIRREVLTRLRGVEKLYFQNDPGTDAWKVASELLAARPHGRPPYPVTFQHIDSIIDPLRLIKSAAEVREIQTAISVGHEALLELLPYLQPGKTEHSVSARLRYLIDDADAKLAFEPIVAIGKNAAYPHYSGTSGRLAKGTPLLIDWGAKVGGYCGDLTRVFPIGGSFSAMHRDLYDIVLAAQQAAIKRIKPGVRWAALEKAALKELTQGLVDLKVLRGSVSTLIEKKAYREYFPHGLGHSLGLTVHESGARRDFELEILKAGMVVTIEPGLYFKQAIKGVPACGIRIEDDILVTKTGYRNLSKKVPKQIAEVEAHFG